MASGGWKIVPGRLLEASGGLLGDGWAVKAARKPNLGGSWVRLGRSWRLLGRSGRLPGCSVGPSGALLAAPGVHFGLPGVTFWSRLDIFLVSPCEITKTTEFVDSIAFFKVFQVPRAPKSFENQLREPLGQPWAAQLKWRYMSKLGYIGPKQRYIGRFGPHVEVHEPAGSRCPSRAPSHPKS